MVYTYAQQEKELAKAEQCSLEKRIQEYRTQAEIDTLKASSNIGSSTSSGGIFVMGINSDKNIEAIMQSSINGEVLPGEMIKSFVLQVQTIKQGYLLKRSSSLRGDWKRRFFVLDSQGTLYYYRNKGIKPTSFLHQYAGAVDHNSGVFAKFRSIYKTSSNENLGCRTVDLRTSTIKMDAEDTDLRLCFRIISPLKTYTLQAENVGDRMDWVNKITAVITSLLNNQCLQQHVENNDYARRTSNVLLPYNQECNSHEPDWASLNLGILLCIECSGAHRNLGVHISKVRSLTLDVKVWEPSVVELFRTLGNSYCNSIWEGSLLQNKSVDESNPISTSITKPCPKDPISDKEKYINAKSFISYHAVFRNAAISNKKPNIIPLLTNTNIVNSTFDDVFSVEWYHHADAHDQKIDSYTEQSIQNDPSACQRIKNSNDPTYCLQGCSLLHLACQNGNPVLVELLMLSGADINMRDFHGRTPLHHCIATGHYTLAKHILKRGARASIRDGGGFSALDRAMEMGEITDEGLLVLLDESH
ncbi:ADP-ribosylation factor GTPase-activating protein AGD2 [Hibiscus syriacus]|uniref:ADP-ribosylation factor GTPase-activating protein AGD2 n=1 Tax=Hibiscus syriacus TaxID=106335 RepID=A0A6A3CY76_HIBSY|nr:ADP-ribosylation factor GTPase-activating protein AGD2 [Hibiscus syriacus]